MQGEAAAVSPRPSAQQKLEELLKHLNEAHEQVGQLAERLDPAMRSDTPSPTVAGEARTLDSAEPSTLVSLVNRAIDQVHDLGRRVMNLRERLEV